MRLDPALPYHGDCTGLSVFRRKDVLLGLGGRNLLALVESGYDQDSAPVGKRITKRQQCVDGFGASVNVLRAVHRVFGPKRDQPPAHAKRFAPALRITRYDMRKSHRRDGFGGLILIRRISDKIGKTNKVAPTHHLRKFSAHAERRLVRFQMRPSRKEQ